MKPVMFAISFLFVFPAWGQSFGEGPDVEFEQRLYRIYVRYNSKPIPEAEWNSIVGKRTTENYTITSGDTLWGISQTLFGNGHFWPKLWQLNSQITNPHKINVGEQITFSSGNFETPPEVNVVTNSDVSIQNVPEDIKEELVNVMGTEEAENQVILPPAPLSRPVIMNIPPSIPNYAGESGDFDETGFARGGLKRYRVSAKRYIEGYIDEKEPEYIGELVESDFDGIKTANLFDFVFVELEKPIKIGSVLTVLTPLDTIAVSDDRDFDAYPFEYQGILKVVEKVSPDDYIYRALVTRIVNPIKIGAKIVPGNIPRVEIKPEGRKSRVKAKILGGRFDDRRFALATESWVYVNAGKKDGVRIGDVMTVYKNVRVRNENTVVEKTSLPIGLVKIVDVRNRYSTGMVLNAKQKIIPGDVTGPYSEVDVLKLSGLKSGPTEGMFLEEDIRDTKDMARIKNESAGESVEQVEEIKSGEDEDLDLEDEFDEEDIEEFGEK